MEVSEQTVVDLVKGQARIEQAVNDLKGAIPYLVDTDKENAAAIKSVERKIWYFGGAGTILGYLLSKAADTWFHIGGK